MTEKLSLEDQEIVAWVGNIIFISAMISQIYHVYKIKETRDISYILQILWFIGNIMYTTFGYLDNSLSMFVGNLITLILTCVQIGQKVYYENYYKIQFYEPIN